MIGFASRDVQAQREKMLKEIKISKTAPTQRPRKLFASHCPHTLPMLGDKVIGAPKINPDIGQVVSNPDNADEKYIRYPIFSLIH